MTGSINGNGGNQPGMNGNQLGGGSPLPQAGADDPGPDQMAIPGVGNIQRGPTDLHTLHSYNKIIYQKLVQADRMLGVLRGELDKLALMGDTVAPEDVIASAGRVVGHGVPARELATLLADMPSQAGQGLSAWVAQQDQALTMQEAHVAQMREIAQHRMGVSAVREMAADEVMARGRRTAAAMGAMGPLGPGGQGPSPGGGGGGMPQPQVVQMAQAPSEEGPASGEAV